VLSDRLRAIRTNVANRYVIFTCRVEINIVRAGGRQADVTELWVCTHVLSRNSNFVAEHKLGAVNALRYFRTGRNIKELNVRKSGCKRRGIKSGPHRRKVKKYSFHMAIRNVVEQSTGR